MEFEPLTSHTKGEYIVINHFTTYRQCVTLFTLHLRELPFNFFFLLSNFIEKKYLAPIITH